MSGARRGLMLLAVLVAMMAGWVNTAAAQIATTTVQDTVYSANGTLASGTVLVSWNAFTTAGGQSVPSGTTSVTIGAGGVLTIALAPNAGSTPMGSYYTAVFHLSDGTTSREYWVIPVTVPGGGAVTLAAIKNQILPISVAMQTVSKSYVDDAIAAAVSGFPLASSPYVLTAGDAMTGPLLLPADPVSPNQAADKNYVDNNVAAAAGGLGQKVSLLPTATQAVAQPSGTNFSINGAYASTTFSSTGTSAQSTITSATTTANPSTSGYILSQNQLNCFQQGFDLGNNGTSAQGWSTCALDYDIEDSATRGIDQLHSAKFSHFAQGDTAAYYTYLTSFGGKVAASDEGVEHTVIQTHQIGYYSGVLEGPGTAGIGADDNIYQTNATGITYINSYPFTTSGNVATVSIYFDTAPTAGQVVTLGVFTIGAVSSGSAAFTATSIFNVTLAATAGWQTFSSGSGFSPVSATQGQYLGVYIPSGTPSANIQFGGYSVSGAPTEGAVTYSASSTVLSPAIKATVSPNAVTGSTLISVPSLNCHGECSATAGNSFADGGILFDATQGGTTATLASYGRALNGMYYMLGSGTVAVSTAWGNIIPNSCTNNGNGQNQVYVSTTCNVTLGTSPASPGSFVAGQDIFLSGPFEEEAAVAAVGTPSGGVQSITFNTRYAWDSTNGNTNAALVMQGGPGGQSFVATNSVGSWPVAYAIVGATSPTQVFFSNCVVGYCNGTGGFGNLIPLAVTVNVGPINMTRTNNVVTLTTINPYSFAVGSSVVVAGMTPSDLDGTFTVLSNTFDDTSGDNFVTWAQTGSNEASTAGGTVSQAPTGVTFYPSAFITGTNNGVYGSVQLGTNTVPFTVGDTVVGAPTSEFENTAIRVDQGQETPNDGGAPSGSISVTDDGPAPFQFAFSATNTITNGVAPMMFNVEGSYARVFSLGYRPANNGAIIYEQGGEPVSANPKPYLIFEDDLNAGGTFGFNPSTGAFSLSGTLTAPGITATNTASAFAAGTTVGGILPCLQNGTDCPAGSSGGGGGGTGSVTSFAVGTWPSWLTPTVTNATTTPTVTVAASSIPNAALANNATTVNGQTCALGSTCTVPVTFTQVTGTASAAQLPAATASVQGAVLLPTGASNNVLGAAAMLPGSIAVNGNVCALGSTCTVTAAPPADVKYYQAVVCDGGTAYASGVTRYDNQQPQAGCVLPASSALAYLAFTAGSTLPQYAEATVSTPPYWTGTNLYINFYSAAVTGTVTWEVQTACISTGSVVGAANFGAAVPVTATVSPTANGDVVTAVLAGIATPGVNGCPSAPTTPGLLTYRIYRSATDTAAGNANLLGTTLVTGRSQ